MFARMGALLFALVLAFVGTVAAQETTGSISGRVVDHRACRSLARQSRSPELKARAT
jgi:hypothetical protein